MKLFISAPVFDLDGFVALSGVKPEGLLAFERRNSRVATLDGLARINDFGYSDADRTLDIRWAIQSQAEVDMVRRMAKAYSRLVVSFSEGCFLGAPGPFSLSSNEAQLQIMVEKRIDE